MMVFAQLCSLSLLHPFKVGTPVLLDAFFLNHLCLMGFPDGLSWAYRIFVHVLCCHCLPMLISDESSDMSCQLFCSRRLATKKGCLACLHQGMETQCFSSDIFAVSLNSAHLCLSLADALLFCIPDLCYFSCCDITHVASEP